MIIQFFDSDTSVVFHETDTGENSTVILDSIDNAIKQNKETSPVTRIVYIPFSISELLKKIDEEGSESCDELEQIMFILVSAKLRIYQMVKEYAEMEQTDSEMSERVVKKVVSKEEFEKEYFSRKKNFRKK